LRCSKRRTASKAVAKADFPQTVMSALGHKRTCAVQKAMSALPPIATTKADMCDTFIQATCRTESLTLLSRQVGGDDVHLGRLRRGPAPHASAPRRGRFPISHRGTTLSFDHQASASAASASVSFALILSRNATIESPGFSPLSVPCSSATPTPRPGACR